MDIIKIINYYYYAFTKLYCNLLTFKVKIIRTMNLIKLKKKKFKETCFL